jgi:hypothetical protein
MEFRGYVGPRRTWLLRSIIGLLALFVIIGLVSTGAYVYLGLRGRSQGDRLIAELRAEEIQPQVGLETLAGLSDPEVVNMAMAEGEWETAYSAVLFSTQLSDRENIGNLLLLGQGYADSGDNSQAELCYQQASLISTLSPTLSDYARANSFLEIAGRFAELGGKEQAIQNNDQAFALAAHSPFVKDPLRADILGELAKEYQDLGLSEKAQECSQLQAELRYATVDSENPAENNPEQPVANFLTRISAPTAAMVASYEDRRKEAIRGLIDYLSGSSGVDSIPQDLATEVAQALVNEDGARKASYEDELAAASSLVLRIGISEARIDWLLIKYRVALGGYGVELVPAWSSDVDTIAAELSLAREELHAIYGEQIDTFGDQTAKDRAWFDVLRLEILEGRLGLYPNYPEQELIAQLAEVTERLIEAGDTSLHPEVVYEDGTPLFSLSWAG